MGNTNPQHLDSSHTGTVYTRSQGLYTVHTDDGAIVTCTASSAFYKELEGWFDQSASTNIRRKVKKVREIRQVDPVAIGDRVEFVDAGSPERGLITGILPRRSKLSRMEPGLERREQIIVSNVDQMIPVISARHPYPRWHLLDRYLATAEEAGIPVVICITKMDLADRDSVLEDEIATYRKIGYRVLLTSAESDTGIASMRGIDAMRRVLRRKVSVVMGISGVGKSTLLNAIQPGLGARVKAISEITGKGRHTTTQLQLYPLEGGGGVIDTPGMKMFGLWHIEPAELALYFREMKPYVGTCKFGLDCTHIHEPGCVVLEAVDAGKITQRRYESYVYLRDHIDPDY